MKNKKLYLIIAIILATIILLMIVLFAGTFISQNTKHSLPKENTIIENTIIEKDTSAPIVKFKRRYIFTNDIGNLEDVTSIIETVTETSNYTTKLIRFEKEDVLYRIDDLAIKNLLEKLEFPHTDFELEKLGTEEIPSEEGIYRAVLEIADEHGNRTLEEIFIIYDLTGARIDDTTEKTIYVPTEDMDKEPEINKKDYTIIDNVDGKIPDESIQCELELHDATKHEWLVHLSYTDRAGNESKTQFLITVKEEQKEITTTSKDKTPDTTNLETATPPAATYNSADTNRDGVIDEQEAISYLHPSEQAVIHAGYGVVVQIDTTTYSVLTHGDGYVDEIHGSTILDNYLAANSLIAQNISGGWINSDNDWYRFIAKNVTPLITPDDEEYWH